MHKAARVGAALVVLFVLWLVVRQLPVLRFIVHGAQLLRGAGLPGAVAAAAGIYLMTLFLVPIIPLIVACGWLYGPLGALIALPAAVASAATAFSLARLLGGAAPAQAPLGAPPAAAPGAPGRHSC